MKHKPIHLGLLLLLMLQATACGTRPQPTSTPTNTPEPFVGGECDPATERVEMNTSIFAYVAGAYTYPEACSVYCLWVPDGSQLKIGISDFKPDLNLHVDTELLVLEYGDSTRWESIEYGEFGPVNESVFIPDPGGRYYIWVCTVNGSASEFTLYNEFTP